MNGRKKTSHRNPRKATDLERLARNEPLATNEMPAFSTRVGITISAFRVRQIDTDGLAGKAVIDGIVALGIIRDDSAKEVAWVHYEACTKVKNEDEEKTVITIEEVE
jgi:hypothetical protein